MYLNDHPPPHFHVFFSGHTAVISIETGEVTMGSLPKTAARLVKEWAALRREALYDNWRRLRASEPAQRIEGLE